MGAGPANPWLIRIAMNMGREVVFDIETQNIFSDVGNDVKKLKISVAVVFDYSTGQFRHFTEETLGDLWPILERAERLIGFNSLHFDIPVLQNYYSGNLLNIPHLDIMAIVKDAVGRRIKLDDIAVATLNEKKSASGLLAIEWWKQGKINEIIKYCQDDVRITRDIYEFGLKNKQLYYKKLDGELMPFPVSFENKNQENAVAQNINLSLPF